MPNFIFHHFINSPLNLYPIPHTFKMYLGFAESGSIFFLILRIMPITLSLSLIHIYSISGPRGQRTWHPRIAQCCLWLYRGPWAFAHFVFHAVLAAHGMPCGSSGPPCPAHTPVPALSAWLFLQIWLSCAGKYLHQSVTPPPSLGQFVSKCHHRSPRPFFCIWR